MFFGSELVSAAGFTFMAFSRLVAASGILITCRQQYGTRFIISCNKFIFTRVSMLIKCVVPDC